MQQGPSLTLRPSLHPHRRLHHLLRPVVGVNGRSSFGLVGQPLRHHHQLGRIHRAGPSQSCHQVSNRLEECCRSHQLDVLLAYPWPLITPTGPRPHLHPLLDIPLHLPCP